MSEKWMKDLLRSKGFSADVVKAIDENVKRDSEEKPVLGGGRDQYGNEVSKKYDLLPETLALLISYDDKSLGAFLCLLAAEDKSH